MARVKMSEGASLRFKRVRRTKSERTSPKGQRRKKYRGQGKV